MFRLVRHADLSLRFYGSERVVLARRNGSRIGVTGQPASVLAQLVDSADDLAALEALARSGPAGGPLQTVGELFRALLTKLDQTPPRGYLALIREVEGLVQHSLEMRVPLFGMFELTYVCNLRCDHCYVLHKVSERNPSEVDEATARRVLDEIAGIGVLDVSLTGGETTLHRGYRQLLAHAKDLHLYTLLKTNGMTMTRRNAEVYAEDPAHETHLSLYGSTAAIHDEMTTVPGSFEKTLQGLRELSRVGIRCKVYVTIWKRNADQLADMRALIEDLGHIASFDDIIHGRLNGDRSPIGMRISREDRAMMVDLGYLRPFSPSPCSAGSMKLKVGADGGVTTCELLPQAFGNVLHEPLERIWRSEEYAGYGRRIIDISKRPNGLLPVLSGSRTSCPGLNVLNTGKLEGPTVL